MPRYTYRCQDCRAELEIDHRSDELKVRCGLSCRRVGTGSFGAGRVDRVDAEAPGGAAPLGWAPDPASSISDAEIETLRRGGMTVYRRSGPGRWDRVGVGADPAAPRALTDAGDDPSGEEHGDDPTGDDDVEWS